MKKFCCVFLAALVSLGVSAPALRAQQQQPGQKMLTVEIGLLSTTHVLFTSDLTYVDISKPDVIAAKVVDASKNMLAIKAQCEFDFVTTVSALEANGTMHTFYVKFNANPSALVIDTRVTDTPEVAQVNTQVRPENTQVQDSPSPARDGRGRGRDRDRGRNRGRDRDRGQDPAPANGVNVTSSQTSNFGRGNAPTLEEVMHKPYGLYHIVDKCYRLEASCVNVFAYSDQTYIVLTLKNRSDIGYEAGDAQFTVETKRQTSKTLSTDKAVWPKSSFGTLSCSPNSETMICYSVPKLTLQKNEVLRIYIYEKGGNRNLFLTLDDKDINYAVSPF